MRKDFTTVKIPTELARRLDFAVKNLGYTSRAEAVDDAVRRFIESLNRETEIKLENQTPLIRSK